MRQRRLIEEASPCDTDFSDKALQTVTDLRRKGPTVCPNRGACLRRNESEGIQCPRLMARQTVRYILASRLDLREAAKEKKASILEFLEGSELKRFWTCRQGEWQVTENKEQFADEVVAFALLMIDQRRGERRPFTDDRKIKPEFGPADAMENALLDLDDVYGEIGQPNPFR